ncbi:MAG: ankyrin repeat domain-containing protein [Dehalococcoidia bacterium]
MKTLTRVHGRSLIATLAGVLLLAATFEAPAPPVVDAVRGNDHEALRALIAQGTDVDAREGDGSTALLWASHQDDHVAARLLLDAGADPSSANDLGATPVWAASMNSSPEMVQTLLTAGADPDIALRSGETPLMIASRGGHPGVVRALLEHGAKPDARGPWGQTALMWAAGRGHSDAVVALVEHGADVRIHSDERMNMMAHDPVAHPAHQRWFEYGGNSALMFAARVGDLESSRHLVAGGADVNDLNAMGVSVLTMAVYANFGDLRVGDNGVGSDGRTRYFLAGQDRFLGRYEDPGLVAFLLEQGADPNAGAGEFTGLHAAIMRQDEAAVELLLQNGADPKLRLGAWTPERRLSYGDFYFHKAWVGAPPIWLAARFGTPRILRLLVDHGADPKVVHRGVYYGGGRGGAYSERQEEVTTPLMALLGMSRMGEAWVPEPPEAVREAQILEAAQLMLDWGVDVHFADSNGRTALDGARVLEYDSVIELLTAAAADS